MLKRGIHTYSTEGYPNGGEVRKPVKPKTRNAHHSVYSTRSRSCTPRYTSVAYLHYVFSSIFELMPWGTVPRGTVQELDPVQYPLRVLYVLLVDSHTDY